MAKLYADPAEKLPLARVWSLLAKFQIYLSVVVAGKSHSNCPTQVGMADENY